MADAARWICVTEAAMKSFVIDVESAERTAGEVEEGTRGAAATLFRNDGPWPLLTGEGYTAIGTAARNTGRHLVTLANAAEAAYELMGDHLVATEALKIDSDANHTDAVAAFGVLETLEGEELEARRWVYFWEESEYKVSRDTTIPDAVRQADLVEIEIGLRNARTAHGTAVQAVEDQEVVLDGHQTDWDALVLEEETLDTTTAEAIAAIVVPEELPEGVTIGTRGDSGTTQPNGSGSGGGGSGGGEAPEPDAAPPLQSGTGEPATGDDSTPDDSTPDETPPGGGVPPGGVGPPPGDEVPPDGIDTPAGDDSTPDDSTPDDSTPDDSPPDDSTPGGGVPPGGVGPPPGDEVPPDGIDAPGGDDSKPDETPSRRSGVARPTAVDGTIQLPADTDLFVVQIVDPDTGEPKVVVTTDADLFEALKAGDTVALDDDRVLFVAEPGDELDVILDGSADITLDAGVDATVNVDLAGASTQDTDAVVTVGGDGFSGNVNISGAADAAVTVDTDGDVNIADADGADINVLGGADVTVETNGSDNEILIVETTGDIDIDIDGEGGNEILVGGSDGLVDIDVSGEGSNTIGVAGADRVEIDTGDGDQTIAVNDVGSVDIETGDGNDEITVRGAEDTRIDSGEGTDDVTVDDADFTEASAAAVDGWVAAEPFAETAAVDGWVAAEPFAETAAVDSWVAAEPFAGTGLAAAGTETRSEELYEPYFAEWSQNASEPLTDLAIRYVDIS